MSRKTKATATKEEATPALVPKLRFPEFRKAAAWEPTTIGSLGDFYYGKSAPKWSLSEDAPTPCVRYGELYTKFGPVITETYSRTNTPPETLRFSKGGEILIPRVGEKPEDFGKCCCYLPLKGIAIGEMISVLETKQHPLFYTHYFRHLHKQFATVVEGQNVKNLYYVELESLPIHRPSLAEQQKIAECLSSVDELMAAQARKVDALKTHKKGLMQQLFPREGETQPRLRFPEFQNAGEWEVKAIGDVFRVTRGEVLSMTLVQDESSDEAPFPVYSSQTKNKGLAGYYSEHLYEDAITWTTDGANAGDVNFRPGKFYCTNVCGVLINTKGYANACVAALLNSVTRSHVSYVGNPKLMNGVMAKIEIPFPSVREQQRIAMCLSTLDALITAETQKHEALKTHKKGLMQQLFPSSEELAP